MHVVQCLPIIRPSGLHIRSHSFIPRICYFSNPTYVGTIINYRYKCTSLQSPLLDLFLSNIESWMPLSDKHHARRCIISLYDWALKTLSHNVCLTLDACGCGSVEKYEISYLCQNAAICVKRSMCE